MSASLAYLAGAVVAAWGVAHTIPTRQVLAGLGPVSSANRRIVLQEWLAEAFAMWGIAAVVIAAAASGGADAGVRAWVYRAASGMLAALATLTALTGARTPVVWFKVCPVLLTGSAALPWPRACCRSALAGPWPPPRGGQQDSASDDLLADVWLCLPGLMTLPGWGWRGPQDLGVHLYPVSW